MQPSEKDQSNDLDLGQIQPFMHNKWSDTEEEHNDKATFSSKQKNLIDPYWEKIYPPTQVIRN